MEEARRVRDEIGAYPLVIRPGFTLGGTGGGIAYDDEEFEEIVTRGLFYSPTTEVLIEESVSAGRNSSWRSCATTRTTA